MLVYVSNDQRVPTGIVKKCRWYLVPVSYYPVLGMDPACILRHFGKILGFSPGRLRARQLAACGDEPGAIGRDRGRDQPAGQGGARSHVDQLANTTYRPCMLGTPSVKGITLSHLQARLKAAVYATLSYCRTGPGHTPKKT